MTFVWSDGMVIDVQLDNVIRIQRKRDGLYVVGAGFMIPCDSYEEAKQVVSEIMGYEEEQ